MLTLGESRRVLSRLGRYRYTGEKMELESSEKNLRGLNGCKNQSENLKPRAREWERPRNERREGRRFKMQREARGTEI